MDEANNPFLATLRLPVKYSPRVYFAVVAVHLISLILPWLTRFNLTIKVFLMFVAILSLFAFLQKQGKSNSMNSVKSLILDSEDNWQVQMQDGSSHHAKLGHSQFVHPWLTIIFLSFDKHRAAFIYTPDNLDADQFRRLRVRLRFKVNK